MFPDSATLKMETVGSSEKLTSLYKTARRHIPENLNLNTVAKTLNVVYWKLLQPE
jgi:hypothetical protein